MRPIIAKIMALCFGTLMWYILSQQTIDTMNVEVPVCFYGGDGTNVIEAPETVTITISGRRGDLAQLDCKELAAHIDVGTLVARQTKITIQPHHLFLPATVKVVGRATIVASVTPRLAQSSDFLRAQTENAHTTHLETIRS